MSVSNFSVQNAAVNLSGLFPAFVDFTDFEGHHLLHRTGVDSRIDVVLTGTACTINAFGVWKVSIDGGAESNIGDNSGHVVNSSIFSALSDTAHTVSMRAANDVFIDQDSTDTTHCSFSLTGAAPAISAAFGFGTQRILSGNAYITKDVGYISVSQNGYPCYVTPAYAGPSLRFYATCSVIKLWTYGNGQKFRLLIDGVDQATVVAAGSGGQWGWLSIASGLDNAAEHLYEIISTVGAVTYAYALMTTGGTGLNTGKTPASRKTVAGYGDSITSASAQGYADTQSSYVQQIGLTKDWNILNAGISGSKVQDSGSVRTSDITGLSPQPDYCFVLYGTNDWVSGGRTPSQLQADFTTMMQALIDGTTNTIFYVLGILPRTGQTQATIDTYNTAIIAAIAATSPNARITYVNTKVWNMASSAYTSGGSFDSTNFEDGLHPNPTGYIFMRDKLLLLFVTGQFNRLCLSMDIGI